MKNHFVIRMNNSIEKRKRKEPSSHFLRAPKFQASTGHILFKHTVLQISTQQHLIHEPLFSPSDFSLVSFISNKKTQELRHGLSVFPSIYGLRVKSSHAREPNTLAPDSRCCFHAGEMDLPQVYRSSRGLVKQRCHSSVLSQTGKRARGGEMLSFTAWSLETLPRTCR